MVLFVDKNNRLSKISEIREGDKESRRRNRKKE